MSDSKKQLGAAKAYVRALRSGEVSASQRASAQLASDVEATIGTAKLSGKGDVLAHISGNWPNTPVYQMGAWGEPVLDGGVVTVEAEFPAFGAGPARATLTFAFNDADEIASVEEVYVGGPRPEPQKEIPLAARGMINTALANGTPMVVAYVDENGVPQLSLRGSVQVFSPTQLCAWLRSAEGGLTRSIAINPNISLLYRDSRTRSTLIVKGTAHIDDDADVRDEVFELAPEVEQNHDPNRTGAALIIDVSEMRGGTPRGGINVQP